MPTRHTCNHHPTPDPRMIDAPITCPKCGHERSPADTAPETECPNCGVIYAKVANIVPRPRVVRPAISATAQPPATAQPIAQDPASQAPAAKPNNPPPPSLLAACEVCAGPISPRAMACPHCGDPVAGPADTPNKIAISNIDMPFWSMVWFMVRWAFATIPALIVVMSAVLVVSMFFGGLGQFFSILLKRH